MTRDAADLRQPAFPAAMAEQALDAMPGLAWLVDCRLRLLALYGEDAARAVPDRQRLCGRDLQELLETDAAVFPGLAAHQAALRGEAVNLNHVWNERLYRVALRPLRDAAGQTTGCVGHAHRTPRQCAAVECCQQQDGRCGALLELLASHAYCMRVERDGSLTPEWVSEGFQRVTGFTVAESEARGGWAALIHPDDMPIAQRRAERLMAGEADVSEFRIVKRSGEVRWLRDCAQPLWDQPRQRIAWLVGAAQDITEGKRMAADLVSAQRLASLGVLVATISHEINNPLHGIVLCSAAANRAREGQNEELLRSCLQRIQEEALRCGRMVRGVLQFAPPEKELRWPGDLGDVVRRAVSLLAEDARTAGVTLSADLPAESLQLSMNSKELDWAAWSLVRGAIEAARPGSKIVITTESVGAVARITLEADHADPDRLRQAAAWELVARIIDQHGGTLDEQPGAVGAVRLVVALPLTRA